MDEDKEREIEREREDVHHTRVYLALKAPALCEHIQETSVYTVRSHFS